MSSQHDVICAHLEMEIFPLSPTVWQSLYAVDVIEPAQHQQLGMEQTRLNLLIYIQSIMIIGHNLK